MAQSYEIVNSKTHVRFGRKFDTRKEANEFIKYLQANTNLKLNWVAKPWPYKREGNPVSKLTGEWIPAHAVRQNADGTVDILREKNSGRRANISEGFMAGGVFHPIRHSVDYDSARAGESGKKRKKQTPTKKKAPARKRAAMVTSRREYGGDGSRYRNPGNLKIKFSIRDRIGKPSKAPFNRNFNSWEEMKEYGQKLANKKKQNIDWKETTGPSFLRRSGVFYAK